MATDMENNGKTEIKQMMMVLSTEEEWSSLKSLLRESFADEDHRLSFSSSGPNQVCDLEKDDRSLSLHCAVLKQDMTEEGLGQALDCCFKSGIEGSGTFLLLIRGGRYTKKERRIVDTLRANFGLEAFKFLVVLSLEGEAAVEVIDDALMELINLCDGRYCRITGPPATGDELSALLEMTDYVLRENGAVGYTGNMHGEAKRRHAEDTAMKMLKEKLREAEEREQAFKQRVQQREENRGRETEALKSKHAEERKKEAAERRRHEAKRESLEEAVRSHGAMLQLQMSASSDDDTKKTSIVLLGLSGSGKSSAVNLILQRAGNQYSINEPPPEAPPPTLACERREVSSEGTQVILVDTPELWDEDGVENLEEVKDCLALALPGPHVFLLVLQVGRFTQGESEMLAQIQKIFGREFTEHAIILFTRCDDDRPHRVQSINDYVADAHDSLRDLIRKCGSRYHVLNVRKFRNALSYPQVRELLSGVNRLVASHGGEPCLTKRFSSEELKERKAMIEERLF